MKAIKEHKGVVVIGLLALVAIVTVVLVCVKKVDE